MVEIGPSRDVPDGGNIFVPIYTPHSVGQGTWTCGASANYVIGHVNNGGSHADDDNITCKVYMPKGTYNLKAITRKDTAQGILDVEIDGVSIGTIDTYNGSEVFNQVETLTDIVVATSGIKNITLRLNGKHASATDYYLYLHALFFYRTS